MSDLISDASSEATYLFESEFKDSDIAYIIKNPNNVKDLHNSSNGGKNDRAKIASTPEDSLKDFDPKKVQHDISTKCVTCNTYINMSELKEHIEYHNALSTLNFKQVPKNLKLLMRRRKRLIRASTLKHLKNEDLKNVKLNEWESEIRVINSAFELIRSYITLTFEESRKLKQELKVDVQADSFLPANPSIVAISSCSNQNAPIQKSMEDNYMVVDEFGANKKKTYIGVFDGYEGSTASELSANQLHLGLLKTFSKFDASLNFEMSPDEYDEINHLEKFEKIEKQTNEHTEVSHHSDHETQNDADNEEMYLKNIKNGFFTTYKQMDRLLKRGKNEKSRFRWSGTTCTTAIIENTEHDGTWLHIANCGNVEALLLYNSTGNDNMFKYKIITRLHTLNADEKEKRRIEKAGGRLYETSKGYYKIEGILDITRALGFHGDTSIKRHVTCFPTVQSIKIEDNCACLIIATKGLWNTLSYKKIAHLVLQMLPSNIIMNPGYVDPSIKELLEKPFESEPAESTLVNTEANVREFVLKYGRDPNLQNLEDGMLPENDDEFDDEYINFYGQFKTLLEAHARPRTAPGNNKHVTLEFDENYDKLSPIKASSDIYPLSATRIGRETDSVRPLSVEYYETIGYHSINKQRNDNDDTVTTPLTKEVESNDGDNDLVKYTCNEFVQVDKFEIHEALRYLMDPLSKHKLEFADTISRKLVISALMAGCNDNITVSCVLFNGCGI